MSAEKELKMDYSSWNDLLVKHYFNSSMAGREVLLYVNSEIVEALGKPYSIGVDDFIESVKKGPHGLQNQDYAKGHYRRAIIGGAGI